ncbi:PglL family O-oligosaccharyltransferase [Roseateles saccharophilus]|uniref:PglL family O-oligosaccharyltransferase n=1 Tax=Roseateles saccharophilus TaxID=304 RepID=UPI0014053B78|nr:O-antigen ligase family protein [Roseateles saccharophilus]MDG0834569.1 polymerase [Roseateles saccharophilus]
MIALSATAALPPLLAYNQTPATTLYNQLLALASWGLVLWLWARSSPGWRAGLKSPAALALVLLLIAPPTSVIWRSLPLSVALDAGAVIGAGLAVLLVAQGLGNDARPKAGEAFFWGLLIAGLCSVAISVVQVFAPDLADGSWIARYGIAGRAAGNLRQPNHLASLMMWAAVAAVFGTERRGWRAALPVLLLAFVFAVVLSASRTGYGGILMLALWGVLDRRLSRSARLSLLATPVMLGVCWWLMSLWSTESGHAFGAASRLAEGAGSPSRLAILRNAWDLTLANPWLGVGWGEFNFAWSLTPFPDRPIAFFDHTHNLVAQLAVELGLPWASAVLALLAWALWRAWRGAAQADDDAPLRRAALMIVLTIGLHSLLEYPLWYAYFLLPACFALGLALPAASDARPAGSGPWPWLGGLLIAGSLFAVWDYQRIVVIYAPSDDAVPLTRRIASGQASPLFGHQADYAAATSLPPGPNALAAAKRTAFSLIDARLLMHWSRSLEVTGDVEGARFLADRLREFRNPTGDNWFAACTDAASAPAMPQCQPASAVVDWRRLR